MKNSTLYLPGFSHQLRGRLAGAQPARRLRDDAHRLDGLAALVARFIPPEMLVAGAAGRERVFTAWVTFVAFLGQVLTRGGTCREAVRRVQAWSVSLKRAVPDDSTSAYARSGLDARCRHRTHQFQGHRRHPAAVDSADGAIQ